MIQYRERFALVPERRDFVKGFSICGLVLGITAAVCGVCAVVFSFLGLRSR